MSALPSGDFKSALELQLQVSEQPAKLHRFRYLAEIKDGRMGSILHSRNSAKVPVKVRVSASSLAVGCRLRLIGGTVFEDLTPHPFYLLGDDCTAEGVFDKEFSLQAGASVCDVSLERIGIVCTPKKKQTKPRAGEASRDSAAQHEENYQLRISKYNLFNTAARLKPLQSKDINQLRLAFQVFVQQPSDLQGPWLPANCSPVSTDVIGDAKIFSEMTVDCIIPKTVTRLDQPIWLYMKDPLPAETASRFMVIVQDPKQKATKVEIPAKSVKKHLVVFDLCVLSNVIEDITLSVRVVDQTTGDSSQSEQLLVTPHSYGSVEPASKKLRSQKADIGELDGIDFLDEFMTDLVSDSPDG